MLRYGKLVEAMGQLMLNYALLRARQVTFFHMSYTVVDKVTRLLCEAAVVAGAAWRTCIADSEAVFRDSLRRLFMRARSALSCMVLLRAQRNSAQDKRQCEHQCERPRQEQSTKGFLAPPIAAPAMPILSPWARKVHVQDKITP